MIRLIDAEKIYDNGTHALKGVSFTVDDGEFVFLVGPSGSGKSTIIKLLTGEVVPTSGRVMVKCGMMYEGCVRGRLYNKGRYVDVALYAILRDDYLRRRGMIR